MEIRVRFNRNVLGRRAGTTDWVEATPIVEKLVENGYLKWLDRPVEEPVVEVLPEVILIDEPVVEIPKPPRRQRKSRTKPQNDVPFYETAGIGYSMFDLDLLNESPSNED